MSVKKKYLSGLVLPAVIVGCLLSSCRDEVVSPEMSANSDIIFRASILEDNPLATRALDSTYITVDPYDMDFHMQMQYLEDGEEADELKIYRIPTGQEGRLALKDTEDSAFRWHGLTGDHYFWGWTLPWETDENQPWAIPATGLEGTYEDGLQPLTLTFYNSGEGDENNYETYKNNDIYETLIGTKRGPVDYYHNGQYVSLTFKHLVSKIVVKRLTLFMSDGSIQNDVKGNITFLGMPDKATFYPHPDNDGAPVVITTPKRDGELTYHIKSDPLHYDSLYVCPEIDFSEIGFYIDITDERYSNYGDNGDYYGSFKNIEFIREAGTDFDLGNDETVLHAGEMMELNIELYPGLGPGMSVHIKDWSTERSGDAVHHSHPGIYTDSEAASFTKTADWENLYELYGDGEDENGNKEIKMYDNVTVDSNTFPVGKGYVVNGMGHLITMKSSSNRVTVGNVRDVYISDGKTTIYIDKDGNIWSLTNRNALDKKIGQLPPFTGNNYLYQINLTNGSVTQTK